MPLRQMQFTALLAIAVVSSACGDKSQKTNVSDSRAAATASGAAATPSAAPDANAAITATAAVLAKGGSWAQSLAECQDEEGPMTSRTFVTLRPNQTGEMAFYGGQCKVKKVATRSGSVDVQFACEHTGEHGDAEP